MPRDWKAYWERRRHHPDARFLATSEWRVLRARQLSSHPLCAHCMKLRIDTPATEVDHIKPPHGDVVLMRDPSNYMSLCSSHHSQKTRHQDRGKAYTIGILPNGSPIMSDGSSW